MFGLAGYLVYIFPEYAQAVARNPYLTDLQKQVHSICAMRPAPGAPPPPPPCPILRTHSTRFLAFSKENYLS